ncbi:MAG: DUF4198 domain-containing protein [Verrucomicrobiota bacterium]|nr:DUF4198 domain-containing protein [Verrucomicrobiota bacterium]
MRPQQLVLLLLALTHAASAHDTWLMPDRFEIAPKQSVTLDLTSGMAFPALETGPKKERVASAHNAGWPGRRLP